MFISVCPLRVAIEAIPQIATINTPIKIPRMQKMEIIE